MTSSILFNTRLLLLVFFCYFDLALSQAQCFFPSGKEAIGDIPCSPTAADSVCCGPGWTCLSSKVCEFNKDSSDSDVNNAIGEQWRGSCTDRQWDSGLCPKFCGENQDSEWRFDGPQLMHSCGQKRYCCQLSRNGSSCCEDGVYINLDAASPVTVIPKEGETVSSSGATTSSDRPRTSSLSSALASSNPSSAVAATSSTDSTPREDSDNNNSTNKGLAAGLGVVLGLAVIGGLLFGLYKWNQRRKMKKQLHSMKRSSAPTSAPEGISLPPSMVERNGQMEWELPTREGDHESASYAQGPYAQTREAPMNQSGYQS